MPFALFFPLMAVPATLLSLIFLSLSTKLSQHQSPRTFISNHTLICNMYSVLTIATVAIATFSSLVSAEDYRLTVYANANSTAKALCAGWTTACNGCVLSVLVRECAYVNECLHTDKSS